MLLSWTFFQLVAIWAPGASVNHGSEWRRRTKNGLLRSMNAINGLSWQKHVFDLNAISLALSSCQGCALSLQSCRPHHGNQDRLGLKSNSRACRSSIHP